MPPPLPPAARPWGFWATMGFSLLIFGVTLGVQSLALVIYIPVMKLAGKPFELSELADNGFFLSIATCLSTPVTVGLTVLLAWVRRGIAVRDYLALRMPTRGQVVRWFLVLGLYMVTADTLTLLSGRPLVPDVMVRFYQSSLVPPLMWFVLVVCAPLAEEILFRGFMFEGLLRSRAGAAGAVVITSLLWSVVHLQYDLVEVGEVFLIGLLLGLVRLRTGSLCLTMLMHGVMNLIATGQVVWLIHTGQVSE